MCKQKNEILHSITRLGTAFLNEDKSQDFTVNNRANARWNVYSYECSHELTNTHSTKFFAVGVTQFY